LKKVLIKWLESHIKNPQKKEMENTYSLDGQQNKLTIMEKLNIRQKLISAIYEYSQDELEGVNDWFKIAMESEEELVDRIIDILEYYHEQSND